MNSTDNLKKPKHMPSSFPVESIKTEDPEQRTIAKENPENEPNPIGPVLSFSKTPLSPTDAQWYAIYTRSRFEKKIYRLLERSGFQAFLPLVKEKRVWSDRIKTVQVPLLPGYVFVKTSRNQFSHIYPYPGFVRFVAFEGKPSVIREQEIELLEKIVTHGFSAQPATRCELGDWVRIVRGPLKGWEGRVESKRGGGRIVFQFEGIRQGICVEVGNEYLE